MSDRSFYKHGEAEFRNWTSGEPNNQNSGELCTHMWENGQWNDVRCDARYKAVCMDVRGENGDDGENRDDVRDI